jgi:hypothetical protein
MSDCTRLSDRIPAVVLGRSSWSADEAQHLKGCHSCQQEWNLVRVSSRLGRELSRKVELGVVTGAVLDQLRQNRIETRRRKQWGIAAMVGAAAAAAMLWIGQTSTTPVTRQPAPVVAGLYFQLPELDNLQPAELNAVLQTLDAPIAGDSTDSSVSDDPDAAALDGGFETWEG